MRVCSPVMDDLFPRKIERKLVKNLCDNLREHPEEWDHQRDRSIHQDGIQIWTDSDFWGKHPIFEPSRLGLRYFSKHKLWRAIKDSKGIGVLSNPNSLAAWIKEKPIAAHMASLSSKANDPIIKYRERFGTEPTKELIKLAESGKLVTDNQE